jgi:hypothetical protein
MDGALVGIYAAGGDLLVSTDPAVDVTAFQASPAEDRQAIAQVGGGTNIFIPLSTPIRKGQTVFISADVSTVFSLFWTVSAE